MAFPVQDRRVVGILVVLSCLASSAVGAMTIFDVMRYGAVGNGRADDSPAFLRAWQAACQGHSQSTTPVVVVPSNRRFLLRPLTFNGPCKSPRIYMLVSGTMVAPAKSGWNGARQTYAWIVFASVRGLVMKGKGVFDGQGSSWWPTRPCFNDPAHGVVCKGPTALIFRRCDGLRLDGFTKINGPGSHILIMSTKDAVVSNLRVIAPGDSPNTDGIDVSGSSNVRITNTFIATGDDCIAISAGSSNIYISGITCGPGHGISIGSLGSGGFDIVENVHVRNSTLRRTLTGVRIKTFQGGKGYARKISFEGIKFDAVDNPIQIDQFYCPLRVNCQNYTSAVAISDVSFTAISGTSTAESVINLMCSQSVGCTNIKLDRVCNAPTPPVWQSRGVTKTRHAKRLKLSISCERYPKFHHFTFELHAQGYIRDSLYSKFETRYNKMLKYNHT